MGSIKDPENLRDIMFLHNFRGVMSKHVVSGVVNTDWKGNLKCYLKILFFNFKDGKDIYGFKKNSILKYEKSYFFTNYLTTFDFINFLHCSLSTKKVEFYGIQIRKYPWHRKSCNINNIFWHYENQISQFFSIIF